MISGTSYGCIDLNLFLPGQGIDVRLFSGSAVPPGSSALGLSSENRGHRRNDVRTGRQFFFTTAFAIRTASRRLGVVINTTNTLRDDFLI